MKSYPNQLKNTSYALWKEALVVSSPVAMGYFPAAIAFGVLASVAGIPWWISILLSVFTFSGAAQYAAIPLIAHGISILNVAMSTFVINLRHVFYALPLLENLPHSRFKRAYCLFALTDECFSLMTTLPQEKQKLLFPRISLLVHIYWVGPTILGIIAGEQLANLIPHLDFALACLFVILWYEQIKVKKVYWPNLIALVAFIFSVFFTPKFILINALAICVFAIIGRNMFTGQVH